MAPGTRRRPRLRVRESKYNPLMGSHTVGIVCFVLGTALTARSLAEGTYEGSLVAAAGRWIRGVLNVSSTHLRGAAKWSWALVTRVVSRGVWRARRLWARLLRRPVPQRVVALGAAHMTAGVHGSATLSVSDPDLETQVRVLREQQGRTSERVRTLENDWAEWRSGHEVETRRHGTLALAFGLPGAVLLFLAGYFLA